MAVAGGFAGTSRFSVRRELGRGGMGVVYEAFDGDLDVYVALKTLWRFDPQALYRLKSEFRTLRQLRHRNLVELHELVEHDGRWFFTMELVHGHDIVSYVRGLDGDTDGLTTTSDSDEASERRETLIRKTMLQLAEALQVVHDNGHVHRDVKPSNIRVDWDGRVVLLDFGLCTQRYPDGQSSDGNVVGTAAYMSPEQAALAELGPPADWYSFGVVLYELLAGTLPFDGAPIAMLTAKQQQRPRPVSAHAPDAPDDLARLADALLDPDPRRRPDSHDVLSCLGAPVSAFRRRRASMASAGDDPFVGRRRELAALTAAAEAVRRGSNIVFEVVGESGVGKTALLYELARRVRAQERGCVVLLGRCHEQESVPFKGLDGLVDSLSRFFRGLDEELASALVPRNVGALRRVFPVLERVPAIARAPGLRRPVTPRELREQASTALRELFGRLGERRLVIAIVDDLQWADGDSVRVLNDLTDGDDAPALLLLTSVRSEHRPQGRSILRRSRELRVDRLSPLDARRLARTLLHQVGASHVSPAHVASAAGGHPLYIGELVHHVRRSRRADMPRLVDAIWARVAQLDAIAREIAELVVVLGVPASVDVFREATRFSRNVMRRALATLRAAMIVRSVGGDESTIEPYHDAVREAVIGRLDDKTLRTRHAQLVEGLRACGMDRLRPELLIEQLSAIGEHEPAARLAVEAGDRALAGAAFDRAAALFARGLSLGDFEAAEVLRVQRAWADALAGAGRAAASAKAYLGAADLVDGAERLELRSLAGLQLMRGGRFDEGLELIDGVLTALGVHRPRGERVTMWRLMRARARLRLWPRRVKPRAAADVSRSTRLQLDTLWGLGVTLGLYDMPLGAYFNTLHLLAALRAGGSDDVACGLAMEAAYCAMSQGTHGRARRRLEIARALASDESHTSVGWCHSAEGLLLLQQCDWAGALASFDRSFMTWQRGGTSSRFESASTETFWMWAAFWSGDFRSLRARQRFALRSAEARGDAFLRNLLSVGLCNAAWLSADQPDLARVENEEAFAPWRGDEWRLPQYWYLLAKLHIALYTGAASEAGSVAELFEELPGWLLRVDVLGVESAYASGRGWLAVARETGDERALARAERVARRLGRSPVLAAPVFAHLLRAGAAAIRDDPSARQHLERAVAAAGEIGMLGYQAAARWALGVVVGDTDGERAAREALAALEELGARDALRMARMLVAGTG